VRSARFTRRKTLATLVAALLAAAKTMRTGYQNPDAVTT